MRGPAAALALWLSLPILADAQAPRQAPRFEAAVELVRVSVSVTDRRHEYVTGLSESDFTVLEDGVRQELTVFRRDELPISLVLLMDCSASMDGKLDEAQAAAVRFIQTLRREDLAQVTQFNERITVIEDFTADREALQAAVRRIRASGATSLYTALYVALKQLGGRNEEKTLRRRAIVLLSDGEDTNSVVSDEQVLELARRTGIAVYAISLRPDRPQDRSRLAWSQAAHFLTTLGRDTGGLVHLPESVSQLDGVYGRIAEELRTQYTLGYVPLNRRRDGKWRRIVVRTPRREDLNVRHKVGYYGPTG